MTISIQTLSPTNKKKFLTALLSCLSADDKKAVKAILDGQKIVSIEQLIFLEDKLILELNWLRKVWMRITTKFMSIALFPLLN